MVIVNIKKEDSKKAFKKEAVFKVPKIKGYPTIRIEKGCDFQRNTNFSYSSQPLRKQAGANAFTMSPKKWIEATDAIGIVSKAGRYGGTYAHSDIAMSFATWISPEF